ncbi:hypothetical protein N7497_002184 [Penicillium chrysogenum]|uniref:Uncharacterized protein n=1 Tax=Penicillium chrysogenum TaxID=5076 RepID=A0ABQ8WV72_PENCH|nr:hypothetical protein N7524_010426 [Penicillium chrysogenum]KAJ5282652.1 hypothetical protein N7505_000632 [Penicillium chrysogenum]KAJ6169341.1 hypothetical protein N7497_002184 [Penicillium chrysogenum]
MSPVNQKTGSRTIRRHLFSLSSVFRAQETQESKRASVAAAVQEEPTCMERIHYPVFNPLDPRHNPEISTLSWNAREQRNSSSESRSPMAWVQSISRRSLHRARSGLMALRSGLRHRSSEESNTEKGFVSPVALRRERQRQGASTGAYTSETQEDMNFGAELSRMDLAPPPPSAHTEVESLVHVPSINSIHGSFATVPASASTSALYQSSSRAVSHSEADLTHPQANDHDLDFQFAGSGELEANMNSEDHLAHTTPSTENHLVRQTLGVAISTDEEIKMSTRNLADPQSACGEQQATNLQQQNTSSDTQTSDEPSSPIPISRQSSAEVRFAFPGVYHEALNQWTRQHGSPSPSQHTANSENSSNTSPHSSSPSQHNTSLSQHIPDPSGHMIAFHEQEEASYAPQGTLERIVLQDDTHSNIPPYHEQDESLVPLMPRQTSITHSQETQPFYYPNPLNYISNRNFGQRWSSIFERTSAQRSSVEDYSSHYTPTDTASRDVTSTEMTSMESTTNDTFSPSPIDSELLFPSPVEDRNEYFLVDGSKRSSHYPDRGNELVKSAQHTTSNCGNTRNPQEPTQMTSQEIMSLPLLGGIPSAGFDFVEEDTDDEFYPGIVQPRQFW